MFWINNIRTRCHLVKRQNLFATHEAIGTGNYKIYHEAIIVERRCILLRICCPN